MEILLRPFFFFRIIRKSNCQLIAGKCTLSTGKLPLGGLPRNTVVRTIDRPNMTSAVYRGRKSLNQSNKQTNTIKVSLDIYVSLSSSHSFLLSILLRNGCFIMTDTSKIFLYCMFFHYKVVYILLYDAFCMLLMYCY